MTVSFVTLGCKVNQYESEAVSELFAAKGYTVLPPGSEADIIIVNSCTVTAESNRKTRQTVRRERKNNPSAVIVLTGCMAEAFPKESEKIAEADIITGNLHLDRLPDAVEKYLENRERTVNVEPHYNGEKFTLLTANRFSEHTRCYIKIEDGCDRFCSYCIIPFARGRVRSKPVSVIADEAKGLADAGYREAVLVGINLSAYGKDSGEALCDAVEAAAKSGVERVRLGSLECDQIDDAALDRLAACPQFCPQFHLSLQSGCDKTLNDMNRRYDTAFYRDLIKRIRDRFDNPSITTDIMVGFSGESDEDFNASCDFVREIGFARSHVFVYSVRNGTAAAKRTDRVPPEVAENRSRIMMKITAECESAFLESQVGKKARVLFESSENGYLSGYTENYTRVAVKTCLPLLGKIADVVITKACGDYCIAELFGG